MSNYTVSFPDFIPPNAELDRGHDVFDEGYVAQQGWSSKTKCTVPETGIVDEQLAEIIKAAKARGRSQT